MNDLEGDALVLGDQGDPDLLGLPQWFWVELASVDISCNNILRV